MTAVSERLCFNLLAVADQQSVVDLLLAGAPSSRRDLPVPRTAPSSALALRYLKKDLKKACAIAATTNDPSVLARYAKDARLSVRRLVAANPATDLATREYLFNWGVTHDRETAEPAMAYLPIQALAAYESEQFRQGRGYGSVSYWHALARAALASDNASLVTRTWALGPSARRAMVDGLYASQPAGVSLSEALTTAPEQERPDLLAQVISHAAEITVELVGLCHEHNAAQRTDRYGRSESRVADSSFQSSATTSRAVVIDAFVHPSDPVLRHLAATTTNPKVMMRLVDSGCAAANLALARRLRIKNHKLPAKVVFALGRSLVRHGPAESTSIECYLHAGAAADLDVIVPLLRQGSAGDTTTWLHGRASVKPRPGDVADLLTDPGEAYSLSRHVAAARYDPNSPSELTSHVCTPWADELVDALAGGFFTGLSSCDAYHAEVFTYVYGRVTRAFGDNPQAWEVFLSLADEWSKSFAELIETVGTLTGLEPQLVAYEPPTPDEESPQGVFFDYDELTAPPQEQ